MGYIMNSRGTKMNNAEHIIKAESIEDSGDIHRAEPELENEATPAIPAFFDMFVYEKGEQDHVLVLKKYTGQSPELMIEKTVGDYTVSVREDCFSGCGILKKIVISSDLDFVIHRGSFKGCSQLEEIKVIQANKPGEEEINRSDDYGVLYLGRENTIIFPENSRFEEYCIPEGIERIENLVPGTRLRKVVFPKSLNWISLLTIREDVEMYFQSSPRIDDSSMVGRLLFIGSVKKENPVHVYANCREIIQLAYEKNWPIFIEYSSGRTEYRPDGWPEMVINTSLIEGTDELEVTGATDVRGDVVIPSSVNGKPVVRIAKNAFANTGMNSLTIPGTIREIGNCAFKECQVNEVTLPESVSRLGHGAFSYSELVRVCFSGGQCQLGNGVFSGCRQLEEVVIQTDIKCIPDTTFEDCSALTSIKLPDQTEEIGTDVFRGCKSLKAISLPGSLKKIGSGAFMGSGLSELVLPDSIAEIPQHLCHDCENLKSVSFSSDIRSIGFYAFRDCRELIEIPEMNHIELLQEGAFENCGRLNDISIQSVDVMGENALAGTNWFHDSSEDFRKIGKILVKYSGDAEDVVIPEDIEIIGDNAFRRYAGEYARSLWMTGSAYRGIETIKKVTVGPQVKTIGKNAFRGCTSLEQLVLSDPDVKIGKDAFTETALVKQSGKYFAVVDDMLADITSLADRLVIPPEIRRIIPGALSSDKAKLIKTLIIGEGVRKLNYQEFNGIDLDELVIPPTVTEITESAFRIWTENKLSGVKKITCTERSAIIPIAQKYEINLEIVDDRKISEMMAEVRAEMENGGAERYLRCGSVIYGHELLSLVKAVIPLEVTVRNFEKFVIRNNNDNMLDSLYESLIHGMREYRIASGDRRSDWSAVATTAVFLSQYGFLTGRWYYLQNKWYENPYGEFMPGPVESDHPILACYMDMKSHYCNNRDIRNAINYACVYDVTVENREVLKQAWQDPFNYCSCLYQECSKAQSDEERVIYNRLIGILKLLAEMY